MEMEGRLFKERKSKEKIIHQRNKHQIFGENEEPVETPHSEKANQQSQCQATELCVCKNTRTRCEDLNQKTNKQ